MMNVKTGAERIIAAFSAGKQAFIPFITAGYPTPNITVELALALQEAGAALLELGVPYSDPLADGPTIQRASAQALSYGVTIRRALELAADMRARGLRIPVVLFTYINPVLQYGEERVFKEMEAAGVDGLLIPDLPPEEAENIERLAEEFNRPLIFMVAPTSEQRVAMIATRAKGFLYCVSSLGVTGVRSALDPGLTRFLARVRQYASVPVAVGFGISTAEQASLVASYSDGFIVGSALLEKIKEAEPLLLNPETKEEGFCIIKRFVKQLQSRV
ncbi:MULTISPECIES: tryptophan synthase subunit alpha [Aneurinibacillus]|uniref:Tryptophan synthase alpha chain n=2 Tax=Aneurinibacillus thermoaerophilus TaxID=143495 RepID=A0A1G8BRZ9_ANETH|nr:MULTISPECIES: tryptophan synthase subunit alpha [Aneurinibacillus]MED0679645.1 tryptophan synthase subunit alpha [Aneurinibacillus thermoaerophilus]MED0737357.1 tryptophan synthase subunit alpha [Aneurinibacillus thermoaerophilus]MED0756206.1 tryptophan synthase subunit alpha [Aneurinibacillus thermoaerophilus]MED0760359.1 tryptophan synthase subunit alpha [Aneurinibacillus thermoaerophilus]MED0764929.1 tryptophan synthase subunit alpha [Aneurinibacillus thermoaerophilus]